MKRALASLGDPGDLEAPSAQGTRRCPDRPSVPAAPPFLAPPSTPARPWDRHPRSDPEVQALLESRSCPEDRSRHRCPWALQYKKAFSVNRDHKIKCRIQPGGPAGMTSLIWFASDRNVSCEHPHMPPPENEDALSAMEPALGLRAPLLFTDTIAGRPGGPGAPAKITEAESFVAQKASPQGSSI